LHAVNAVFFYFVARRLLFAAVPQARVEDNWRRGVSAELAALLFAVHPLRVESGFACDPVNHRGDREEFGF
jgi:hypothetical protein